MIKYEYYAYLLKVKYSLFFTLGKLKEILKDVYRIAIVNYATTTTPVCHFYQILWQ